MCTSFPVRYRQMLINKFSCGFVVVGFRISSSYSRRRLGPLVTFTFTVASLICCVSGSNSRKAIANTMEYGCCWAADGLTKQDGAAFNYKGDDDEWKQNGDFNCTKQFLSHTALKQVLYHFYHSQLHFIHTDIAGRVRKKR